MEIRYDISEEFLVLEVEAGYLHVSTAQIPLKNLAEALKPHLTPAKGRPKTKEVK